MSAANVPPQRFRWRRAARIVLLFALVAVAVWQGRVHFSAWTDLKEGRAALDRDDPATARRSLERCLGAWPLSSEANYRAAQAARRCGDLDAATEYLIKADRSGRPGADIEVEYALVKTQSGQFAVAESALLHHLNNGHAESPQILAVLTPVYATQYRWVEAGGLAEKWVQSRPSTALAWKTQAEIQERLRKTEAAADSLRKVAELTPDDRKARLSLARLILETRQPPDEAARHAEWLTQTDPRDAAALFQLAACRAAQSRTEEAVALLDRLIAEYPPDPKVQHLRGKLALLSGPAAALPFLRRAADLDTSDPDLLYSLFLCLEQAGAPTEAAEVEKRWRQCSNDLSRVRELAKAISATPRDPELRREMGELFLRNKRDTEGLRWLESALQEAPTHVATHRALAVYYERTGQPTQAARHRAFLVPPSSRNVDTNEKSK